MSGYIEFLDGLNSHTIELISTFITAAASLVGIVIAAILAKVLASVWLSARDKQDKEVEWRNHAIELTKLDLDRKKASRVPNDPKPLRPSILDFLANYRDLQELGEKSPKELYIAIIESRISQKKEEANKQINEEQD